MAIIEDNSEKSIGNTVKPNQIRDVFFFPHVRTVSHVLCRLLSGQPGWAPQSDYHFKRAFDFARESFNWGPLTDVPDQIRNKFEELLQEGFDEIQRDRRGAKDNVGYSPGVRFVLCGVFTMNRARTFSSKNTRSIHGILPNCRRACGAATGESLSP